MLQQADIDEPGQGRQEAPKKPSCCLKFTNHNRPAKRTLKRKQSRRCPFPPPNPLPQQTPLLKSCHRCLLAWLIQRGYSEAEIILKGNL